MRITFPSSCMSFFPSSWTHTFQSTDTFLLLLTQPFIAPISIYPNNRMSPATTTVIDNQVVLWDISSKLPSKFWSPNTMKVRAVLNFRGIPFESRFLTYSEFPGMLEQAGVQPWLQVPRYTLPAISYNGNVIMGSDEAVAYLEKAFPHNPSVYPSPEAITDSICIRNAIPAMYYVLDANSGAFVSGIMEDVDRDYFVSKFLDRGLADIPKLLSDPQQILANWALILDFLNNFQGLTSKDVTPEQLARLKSGKYLFGDYCSYADLLYFSLIFWTMTAYSQDKSRTSELITDAWLKDWYRRMAIYGV
ncbi:hypothetical protein BABINDRAFT_149853 [Babjeviella inositovora NRRL Y-12698]|uniref:GST N-terminal domain-containing protein n=1 Tax=Babjeviella inositovora NRRL Y-12698 TaxID=984486 RepID=A0A1E3QNL6_9ASCO|nr:uncharacterized protein BABINDRAFT_149853 [Babjeviella inositovora NRRL Y-12698]ODQ79228.1 hypothetical protein BABINDRAFT_149853 [Babjeviella inositovora NRRL Y-12698]